MLHSVSKLAVCSKHYNESSAFTKGVEYLLAERQLASQERLSSVEFVRKMLNSVKVLDYIRGRAIALAMSHKLPTLAAWVRFQLRSCGTCG
jgi:hypothetical protein